MIFLSENVCNLSQRLFAAGKKLDTHHYIRVQTATHCFCSFVQQQKTRFDHRLTLLLGHTHILVHCGGWKITGLYHFEPRGEHGVDAAFSIVV